MLKTQKFSIKSLIVAALILLLTAFSLAGCQPAAPATPVVEGEHDHEEEGEHEHEGEHDHEGEDEHERVPNDGAIIQIIAPTDGATFQSGEDIVVEVEVENFELGDGGNHWHLYVDGTVTSMVGEGSTKTVIHNLETGEHEIEVYLGLPTHEELEEGDSVTITVTE